MKNFIIVITVSVFIGAVIFFGWKILNQKPQFKSGQNQSNPQILKSSPSPLPTPALKPIDTNTNLKEEADKLVPDDFSSDFEKLKSEI